MAKRSLHIGINDYPGVNSDLRGCVNDANDWEAALNKRGFTTEVLLDSAATKKNIVDKILKLVDATRRDDIAVISYSGHGTWIPDLSGDELDDRDEALCPWDMMHTGEVLSDDELYEILCERMRGARIILLSDSCHSGTVNRMGSRTQPPFINEIWNFQKTKFFPPGFLLSGNDLLLAKKMEHKPRRTVSGKIKAASVLLSGCSDLEYSYDAWFNQRPNGAFSYVALWCLNQLTEKSTYHDWWKLIREYLPHSYYPQTPQLDGSWVQRKKWKVFSE